MGNPRIFISYAFVSKKHPDYLFAQRLAEDLRQTGAEVILDDAYIGDQAFVQQLNKVLPSCQWLNMVQTPDALQSLRVQMSVSTALNLVAQKKMRDVTVVSAIHPDSSEIPQTWANLKIFDASTDYQRAVARIKLELGLDDLVNTSTTQSNTASPFEPNIDRFTSNDDDKPLGLPPLSPSPQKGPIRLDTPRSL